MGRGCVNGRGHVMKRIAIWAALLLASGSVASAQRASAVLDAAAKAMGTDKLTSIEYTGNGSRYFLGQSPTPGGPYPRWIVQRYVVDINYATKSMREEIDRTNEDGSGALKLVHLISGSDSWDTQGNVQMPGPVFREMGSSTPSIQERSLRIWLTPAGFIKAAQAGNATVKSQGVNMIVSFTNAEGRKMTGVINAQHLVEKVSSWSDNPILGDMPVEVIYTNYQTFGDVRFPTKIEQIEGGQPFIETTVTDVKPNGAVAITVPDAFRGAKMPAETIRTQKLGNATWFIGGGSHNSLAVAFNEYVVLIEAPLNEARGEAVIAEVHKLVPNKPIRYVVNTHNHFDHLGGVRAAAAEGITVIAPAVDKVYYEKIFKAPHTLNPDALSKSGKKVIIEGVKNTRVLTDGTHSVELDVIPLAPHVDAMMLVYLPKDKVVVQADINTVLPANAPLPANPNPWTVQLYEEIRKQKWDVEQIAGIHGGVTTMADLEKAAGRTH
jgi:glyoxylase-like metal-dependent hydrolase (beta-lactamase superfamily II)